MDNRIALRSTIDFQGTMINIFNLHYALENYYGQVKATMGFVNETNGPIVLLGDLNRLPYHPELKQIKEELIDSCDALETIAAKKACRTGTLGGIRLPQGIWVNGKRIDYIFVDSNNFHVVDIGLTPSEYFYVSDHRAYWAKIRILN